MGQPVEQSRCLRPTPPSPSRGNRVVELLHPGMFVTLRNQPRDLPPFQVVRCRGGRCWVRQQSWGPHICWEVPHHRLSSGRA
ncbi:hypothetical protein EVJ50_13575 [Synechococcus sp. RSCCF101]|uniref:hypothetical protein n=1 Tax=Synechococcus sp. RSCCF101 TaxID=2511069 RepID=UPI0012460430|nr:hypothetical protein [Synechococcus sp. RSCCF101]QEY33108.1 hypothetical protein EVJ50_13575 [Synechococcus sp. RSCCF101]